MYFWQRKAFPCLRRGRKEISLAAIYLADRPSYNPLEGGEGINSLVGNYSMSRSFALPRTNTGSKSKPRSYNSLSLWLVQNRWRERREGGRVEMRGRMYRQIKHCEIHNLYWAGWSRKGKFSCFVYQILNMICIFESLVPMNAWNCHVKKVGLKQMNINIPWRYEIAIKE